MSWRGVLLGLIVMWGLTGANPAAAQTPLVADLSDDFIALTAGFSGSEVLLFGATEGEGDVIVVVRGPNVELVVRRKEKIFGIWVNWTQATYPRAPSFYHLAASGPVTELLDEDERRRVEIGFDSLEVIPDNVVDDDAITGFRDGLIRVQQARELYSQDGEVRFVGERLFRTQVAFPATVSPGDYTVFVYLVQDGAIVSSTTTPLQVRRFGFEERMFEFANEQSLYYGLIAILLALMAGWLAGVVFRRA